MLFKEPKTPRKIVGALQGLGQLIKYNKLKRKSTYDGCKINRFLIDEFGLWPQIKDTSNDQKEI